LHTLFDPGCPKSSTLAQRVAQYLLERRAEGVEAGSGLVADVVVTSALSDGAVWVLTAGSLEALLVWLCEDCPLLGALNLVDAMYPFDRCVPRPELLEVDPTRGPLRIAVWPRDRFPAVASALEGRTDLRTATWSPQRFESTLSVAALPEASGYASSQLERSLFDPRIALRAASAAAATGSDAEAPAAVAVTGGAALGQESRKAVQRWAEWRARLGLPTCRRVLVVAPLGKREAWCCAMRAADSEPCVLAPGAATSVPADMILLDCSIGGDVAAAVASALGAAEAAAAEVVVLALNLDAPLKGARHASSGGARRRRELIEIVSRGARNLGWLVVLHHLMTDREPERTAVCRRIAAAVGGSHGPRRA